jgi:hypothetical protein
MRPPVELYPSLVASTPLLDLESWNHLEVIANTVANTVARITNSVFVITYLLVWVAYMSDLLISRIC